MKPTLTIGNAVVYHGNNLDVLPTLPDNSVDSIVCDPPYELGFMGKKWDSSGIAYSVELWTECMRVLKPGGHLLAFGGSRTWHRLAVAIEDAGFEIRDSIAWLYGSGFPKSMDISKAIDKHDATEARNKRDLQFVEWMRSTGITAAEIDDVLKNANLISSTSNRAIHYFNDGQPNVATAQFFDAFRHLLPEVPDYIEQMVAERTIESQNFKKREVIGQKIGSKSVDGGGHGIVPGGITENVSLDITAPATDEAKQWAGWGTALKPAFEPVVVARKPLIGTVAENVLTWGVGGLNIDGSRIGFRSQEGQNSVQSAVWKTSQNTRLNKLHNDGEIISGADSTPDAGRWPANIILDEYTAGLLDEQSGQSASKAANRGLQVSGQAGGLDGNEPNWKDGTNTIRGHNDSGGASRFFYVAKASKKDRNEGLEELPEIRTGAMQATEDGSMLTGSGNERTTTRANFHPTVKPTAIMEYLIKLVTPPNGTVLDPFTGSGSTGKAALLNGFKFIGIELTEEYLPIIEGRLTHASQAKEEEESETLF